MLVRDAMSPLVVEVGPGHTLAQAARLMAGRNVGAAIVMDPEGAGPGILTERDVLRAVAAGDDLAAVAVAEHTTTSVVYAEPTWSLDEAAAAMVDGGFRHLVVMQGPDVVGVLSVRDIARSWAGERGLLDERRAAGGGNAPSGVVGIA
ncbi:CBS domain-containing protein [Patulibacter minatonensis]|uniref:CBS domain-containing protein n=1 Tax=Patulibacter minatonensis TaxID=298163 RepID=UPI00047EDB78